MFLTGFAIGLYLGVGIYITLEAWAETKINSRSMFWKVPLVVAGWPAIFYLAIRK